MDPQIKKGSLEMCILMMLNKKDCYGYEVSKSIGELLQVKEGTIYLVLQRLERTTYVDSYEQNTDIGRKRKYYKLTDSGKQRMLQLIEDYNAINKVIDQMMNDHKEANNE